MNFDEKEIIEECKKGKPRAQKALYDKYSKKLFGLCIRYCRNSEDAQDVFQEAFVKVYYQLDKYDYKGSFEGWMRRVFVNHALNYYRYDKRNVQVPEYEIDFVDQNVFDRFTRDELLGVIQRLSHNQRMIFNMVEVEGYSYTDVAEFMSITESGVRSQNFKAKRELQRMLLEAEKEIK